MIRMSRLTDYGVVLMTYMATHPERQHNAAEVAAAVQLPPPTVSKLLRTLARRGLLVSHRGVKGGYSLARSPEDITLVGIIRALEGPFGLTVCTEKSPGTCEHEPVCPVQGHWHKINRAIGQALEGVNLASLVPATSSVSAATKAGGSGAMPPSVAGHGA